MRKWFVALSLFVFASCAVMRPVSVFAQVPATLRAQWDAPVAGDNVGQFLVSVDGGAAQTFAKAAVCTATGCEAQFVVSAYGAHTVSVVAQNLALSTDPTSWQNSGALNVTFTLNPVPGNPKNGQIKK